VTGSQSSPVRNGVKQLNVYRSKDKTMSLTSAKSLIAKMKSDEAFRGSMLADCNVDHRLAKARAEGFDCSLDDITQLQTFGDSTQIQGEHLPLSWQAGGPCHRKCAAIIG